MFVFVFVLRMVRVYFLDMGGHLWKGQYIEDRESTSTRNQLISGLILVSRVCAVTSKAPLTSIFRIDEIGELDA